MKRLIEQRYVVRQNILTIIGLCLCAYFTYHVVMGERSKFRYGSLEQSITRTTAEYEQTRVKREQLEARVIKLRPGSIDPDLLEERARVVLGFARDDEHVVILPN
jgi:cell division protein FtsB